MSVYWRIALGMRLDFDISYGMANSIGMYFYRFSDMVLSSQLLMIKTTRTAVPEESYIGIGFFVMAMNYLAILLCPFIIDFFQSMLHVKSQQFAFIFNLCIALVATIWAYVERDSFLFNDKI